MFQSRVSVIQGHTRDPNTDHLYEPLRKTFLEDTTAKKTFLSDISQYSHFSHNTRIHSQVENHQLGETTLINEDRKLYRKRNVTQLPDPSRYCIVNAEQRVFEPISLEEYQSRVKPNPQDQIIVYTYGDEPQEAEVQQKFEAPPKRKYSGIKITQPKYNLFSVLDEGFNNIISGKACTCPSNELIAADRREITWDIKNN